MTSPSVTAAIFLDCEAMQRDIEEATARKANIVWDSDWNKRNTVF